MHRLFPVFLAVIGCASGQWLHQRTAGLPRSADGKVDLAAPAPKTADGKPDLSGVWRLNFGPYFFDVANDLGSGAIQPWAENLFKQRLDDLGKDRWTIACLPGGPALGLDKQVAKIVQARDLIVVLYEDLTYRQIFLDGRELPPDPNPAWMGYSVGRWQGDTLVVESAGFNDRTWLDYGGHPHTEALRITESYRRLDLGHIDLEMTYSDPGIYAKPWTIRTQLVLAADIDLLEYVCAENEKDRPHLVGKASDVLKNAVTVAPELLSKYAGTYMVRLPAAPAPVPVRVELTPNGLIIDSPNGKTPLTPQSESAFLIPGGASFRFVMDETGEVTHAVITAVEGDTKAIRVK